MENMEFDINLFESKIFKDRTFDIDVSELKDFFKSKNEKDEKKDEKDNESTKPPKYIWTVRGLTASEIAIANESVESNRNLESFITAISSKSQSDKVDAVKDVLGLPTDKTPNDLVRRFSMLVAGSVSPKCPQNIAVKLADSFPTTFYKLTNKIIELTGEGKLGE